MGGSNSLFSEGTLSGSVVTENIYIFSKKGKNLKEDDKIQRKRLKVEDKVKKKFERGDLST